MLAKDVMSGDVVSLELTATVKDAIALFQESPLHGYPVIDAAGRPVGMVTACSLLSHVVPRYASFDLLNVMKGGPDIESLYRNLEAVFDHPITEVVDERYQTTKDDTPVSAVAAQIISLRGDSGNIMVVDHDGRLVGIISGRDLVCRVPLPDHIG